VPVPAPHAGDGVSDEIAARLSPAARAELRLLEHLGWRLVRDPSVAGFTVAAGTPCYRKDLATAQAAGDLQIKVPATVTPEAIAAFSASLPSISQSLASRCAYLQKVQLAVGRATRRLADLQEAGRYDFPQLLFWNSPIFKFRAPESEWTRGEWSWKATNSASGAIGSILEVGGLAECYAAQQVAVWATQYYLFGPEAFDEAYSVADVIVGRPPDVMETEFGRFGDDSKEWPWKALVIGKEEQEKDPGLVLASLGPKAFAGVTGILRDQNGTEESNENFTIVSVTPRLVEQMKANGGFQLFTDQCKLAWDRWNAERRGTASKEGPTYEQIMSQPIFTDFVVYVQPFGVSPVRKALEKEMIEEKNGPVYVLLYLHGREDESFRRYRETWKSRFARGLQAGMGDFAVPSRGTPPPAPPAMSGGR
jgi:hypothetical protein